MLKFQGRIKDVAEQNLGTNMISSFWRRIKLGKYWMLHRRSIIHMGEILEY
jgi:hypothetical protein